MTTPIAWLDLSRQLHTVDATGRESSHTPRIDRSLMWGSLAAEAAEASSTWSWPTWSPDGKKLAVFRAPSAAGQPTVVQITDPAGVQAIEPASLATRLPIYLCWSPRGTSVAVLAQDRDRLGLQVVQPGRFAKPVDLATGSPLFFAWSDEHHLAAFVGNPDAPSQMRQLGSDGSSAAFPGEPGNFCAPTPMADGRVAYVVEGRDGLELVAARAGDERAAVLESVQGLVALVGSPDGRKVARAIAPLGDGTPYREIAILDPHTGAIDVVWREACLAFFWTPDGNALVVCRVDTERNLLQWHHAPIGGQPSWLATLQPTRDFGFYLRFFEQFSISHPIVDDRYVLLAGTSVGRDPGRAPPAVRRLDWRTGEFEVVGEGVFGTFARVAPAGPPG